ncbi:MAG: hydroxymethylbilane synthase [Solirubrobacteraceae bacterium]
MRIGSRGSSLARVQADHVAKLLGGAEVVVIRTSGDQRSGAGGDKSRWVDTIEQALLEGEIDLAVHSAKDVPGELASGLALLGVPERGPVEDVICGAGRVTELPYGATVGTSSLRRAAQLLAARPDLQVCELNGNVDTRLAKLSSHFDAIVLARAGLERLQREQEIGALLDPETFVPSPGQGALALEGRADDQRAAAAAEAITDATALPCLQAERELARVLQASCNTPLGAWCAPDGVGMLRLRGWVGLPDGSAWIADELEGEDPVQLAQALGGRMISVGAKEMLAQAEAMAP